MQRMSAILKLHPIIMLARIPNDIVYLIKYLVRNGCHLLGALYLFSLSQCPSSVHRGWMAKELVQDCHSLVGKGGGLWNNVR